MTHQERIDALNNLKEKNRADSAALVADLKEQLAILEADGDADLYVILIRSKNLKIFIDLNHGDSQSVFRPYQASLLSREKATRLAKMTRNGAGERGEAIRVGDAMREMIEEEPRNLERHLKLLEDTLEDLLKSQQ